MFSLLYHVFSCVRGVNNPIKSGHIRELIMKINVEIVCLTETRIHNTDQAKVASLWDNSTFEFNATNATIIGNGGVLCNWNLYYFLGLNNFTDVIWIIIVGRILSLEWFMGAIQ